LTFAALIAAIVSSLGSMSNSIATIATMDLYKSIFNHPNTSEQKLVTLGRIISFASLVLAVIIAKPLLGQLDQAFQYIQEFTGFFTPGIVAIFLFGFFWKKATALGALLAAFGSAALSLAFKLWMPDLPFMDRVGIVFLLCCAVIVVSAILEKKGDHPKAVNLDEIEFSTTSGFKIAAGAVVLILVALYAAWW
jgi:SSS family solute:Na+ symporter